MSGIIKVHDHATVVTHTYVMHGCIIINTSRGGHIYTFCTDTRDWDQSEIKWSSCKIGDNQAIKISVCAAQIKVKRSPIL